MCIFSESLFSSLRWIVHLIVYGNRAIPPSMETAPMLLRAWTCYFPSPCCTVRTSGLAVCDICVPLWTRQPTCCFCIIHHHGQVVCLAKRAKLPQGGCNLVAASVLDKPFRRDIVVRREHNVAPIKVEVQRCSTSGYWANRRQHIRILNKLASPSSAVWATSWPPNSHNKF